MAGKRGKYSESALQVKNLTVSYGPKPALLDISFDIPPGIMVGIIGPNGSGKSTLLKSILGFIEPDFGSVNVFGNPLAESKGKVAYVPQRGAVDWDFPVTVEQVALMGRYGKIPWWKNPGRDDRDLVDDALKMVKMENFRKRQIGQLSGGQQQRVFMARALTQGADLLLLDEPFAGVDAATERAILDVLEAAKKNGQTLIVVHHDLATAAEYFDRIILIKQRLYAYGPPEKVLDTDLLSEVYEGNLRVFTELKAKEAAQ
jgi:manganese/iron transport system ATP-binding protein/manganese/zinc/iron transport system ATP- binding protein